MSKRRKKPVERVKQYGREKQRVDPSVRSVKDPRWEPGYNPLMRPPIAPGGKKVSIAQIQRTDPRLTRGDKAVKEAVEANKKLQDLRWEREAIPIRIRSLARRITEAKSLRDISNEDIALARKYGLEKLLHRKKAVN